MDAEVHFEFAPVIDVLVQQVVTLAGAGWRSLTAVYEGRREGKRMPLNGSWIAATALANRLPVVAQDDDYDGVPGLVLIRV